MLRRLVGTRFQVLFHSPPGVLFTFPSRYWFTIGHQDIFRLGGWSRQIHTRFHGPRATRDTPGGRCACAYGGHTLCATAFNCFGFTQRHTRRAGRPGLAYPTTPLTQPLPGFSRERFSLFRFRSPLLTESLLFSLPVGTEMFHFPTFPPAPYRFRCG
jgi:hypothetical protein